MLISSKPLPCSSIIPVSFKRPHTPQQQQQQHNGRRLGGFLYSIVYLSNTCGKRSGMCACVYVCLCAYVYARISMYLFKIDRHVQAKATAANLYPTASITNHNWKHTRCLHIVAARSVVSYVWIYFLFCCCCLFDEAHSKKLKISLQNTQ